jgi:hypothetical protein
MMKLFLSWILSYRVGQLRYFVAKTYLETLSQIRRSVSVIFGILLLIALFAGGLVLMTLGVVMIIPTSMEGRGLIVLCVGFVVLALSLSGYFMLNSERMWIKVLRVESVLKELAGDHA